MRKVANTLGAVAIGCLMLAGLAGCSMFSASNAPVDCNIVKVQREAGKTDAQIASDLSAKEDEVAACGKGPAAESNKNANIPQNY